MTIILCAVLLALGVQAMTVAEAITTGLALDNKTESTDTYTFEGYVNVITENAMTSWGNMTFWIADRRGTAQTTAAGAIQIYRGKPDQELVVGDKVQVVGKLKHWNSKIESAEPTVTWLEGPSEEEEERTSPVDVPNVGDEATLKVFAQNVLNYYYNYNTGRGKDADEFPQKTSKMVDAMLWAGADIIALCEVEDQPEVLAILADSLNNRVEGTPFKAIDDGSSVEWRESADYNIKAGFVYNSDKVRTIGDSYGGTWGSGHYSRRMRIQTFEEIASGQRFTLSMNHFKASSGDENNERRKENATNLIDQLAKASDPDILILGDLNCQVGTDPIVILNNAGYDEILVQYEPNAYSYCWGSGELIDHVMANASMAEQITGAGVYHISTSCSGSANYEYRYSDHDPYIVGLKLEKIVKCEEISDSYLTSGLGSMTRTGSTWSWYSNYNCAYARIQTGGEDYLLTPEMDLSAEKSCTLSFLHTTGYATTPTEEMTLWVTANYQGSVEASEWKQLTIDTYPSKNWEWKDVSMNVPMSYVGEHTVFAFKYMSTAEHNGTWEVKNLTIEAGCTELPTNVIEYIHLEERAQKTIENGQLVLILPDGSKYNVMGVLIR